MWAPFVERMSMPNRPSCDEALDQAISSLQSAILRCQLAEMTDDEIYGKIVREINITHEQLYKEEARRRKPQYEGDNLKEVLQSIATRLDELEDKINV
jgi:hypothetical protein